MSDSLADSPASQPAPAHLRSLDAVAVDRVLRRMASRPAAPWLHGEVARRMADRLAVIRLKPKTLVDWWGFTGASEELLAAAYPDARRLIVEPTEALRERSREQRPSRWSPRRWVGPAVEVIAPEALPDRGAELLWSNMMLHAAVDPPAVLAQWHRAVAVDGFVMYSCFGPGTLRQLRALYASLGWPAPSIDFVDMHDLGDMMVHAGFADPVMDQETLTLTWDGPEALLEELRGLGGNVSPARHAGLRGRSWRAALFDGLRARAQPDGRIALDFEIAYGHAFKPVPRVKGGAETSVSLEEMRSMVRSRPRRP